MPREYWWERTRQACYAAPWILRLCEAEINSQVLDDAPSVISHPLCLLSVCCLSLFVLALCYASIHSLFVVCLTSLALV